jgi:type I restriction enzyme M protein
MLILLPEKLFYNTGAPGAIIIFNHHNPKSVRAKYSS